MAEVWGYARVSGPDQDLTIQRKALKKAGATTISAEKKTGTTRKGRTELEILMEFLRRGDTLLVTRIDRLARSLRDLQNIVYELEEKGVTLRATEQPIDKGTPGGQAFLSMLGVFAEFETALRRERQMEGIAKAKERGAYHGRKASIDRGRVGELRASGLGASEIAKQLGCSRASVYRVMAENSR